MKLLRGVFFGLIGLAIISTIIWLRFLAAPSATNKSEVVSFPDDTASVVVVTKLREQGFIKSETALDLILLLNNHGGQLPAGGYQLSKSNNVFEIAGALISGPQLVWITVIPGQRKEQIEERLGIKLSGEEGKYFPGTYLIPKDASGEQVSKIIQDRFIQAAGNVGPRTLIIASLVQREAAGPQDASLIAGIIWNRLLKNMALQIDASSQYAIGRSGDWWPTFAGAAARQALQIDSLYNLYLHHGLPPAPICNPSLYAIRAAQNPATTDCLYYLHDHNRQIHCSVTYQQHLDNIAKYLQ